MQPPYGLAVAISDRQDGSFEQQEVSGRAGGLLGLNPEHLPLVQLVQNAPRFDLFTY